jgi:hypothetical protein
MLGSAHGAERGGKKVGRAHWAIGSEKKLSGLSKERQGGVGQLGRWARSQEGRKKLFSFSFPNFPSNFQMDFEFLFCIFK